MQEKEYSIEIGGKTMTAEFNDWADQASGSVLVRYGNSAVLATAVMGGKTDRDYFPLSVEYEEKFYAAGAILGGQFTRREGRPSDEAVLSGRVVDRTIRPLFPKGLKRDIQIVITVLSIDEDDTDVIAVNAASLAIATSNIPWNGPVSAVRLGLVNGDDGFIANPVYKDREDGNARLDLLACGKDGLINMIEVGALEVPEDVLIRGLEGASEEIERIQTWQKEIIAQRGAAKSAYPQPEENPKVAELFKSTIQPKLEEKAGALTKFDMAELKIAWLEAAAEEIPDVEESEVSSFYEHAMDAHVHELALEKDARVDGRTFDEIRPLYAKAGGISPVIHGTGLFYRGATHVLAALTLGGPGDAQMLDTIESQDTRKRFMLHYNFPPFSVGETGRVGGFNRRQIGHGTLAEKALRPVIPEKTSFPYTIRIVAECLASNGSTSMASVCAGTIALMDAGVPITRPVAGIAMGMMSAGEGSNFTYKVLTDIQGPEDHHGDMDFKVAGTTEGITAVQMDVKVAGVPIAVLAEAFEHARKARLTILETITKEISEPRPDINPRAPKIISAQVKVEQIGLVIGPGGKTINGIKERTGVEEITIEDDGAIFITGKNGAAEAALKEIELLTHEYKAGERFEDGEVTRLMDFGAFVKIAPNTEGLVHVSEIAPFRINRVESALSVGEKVPVIIKEIDEKHRINLSIKDADASFAERKGLKPENNNARGEHTGERTETVRRQYNRPRS